jgi:hypothetical protein
MRLVLKAELHTLRILYNIETAELTYRGITKGRRDRKTDNKCGDNHITPINSAQTLVTTQATFHLLTLYMCSAVLGRDQPP